MKAQTNNTLAALKVAMNRRDRSGINQACERLMDARAPLGPQWKSVITLLEYNGEHVLADRAAALWTAQSRHAPIAVFERVAVLARAGRAHEALALLETVPADFPSPAGHLFTKGTINLNLGRLADAKAMLRAAARVDRRSGQSWLALAMAGPVNEADGALLLEAGSEMESASAIERSAWLYAVGKLHGERGDHAEAFKVIEEGASLMRGERRYDRLMDASNARAARMGRAGQTPASMSSAESGYEPPIFVTGLPRSGTTLVEQILTSHSAVAAGGELGLFRILEQDMEGKSRLAFERHWDGAQLRSLYFHLVRQRFPGRGRIVDKTLNASRYMGLIGAIFPDAPIIWVRRDPLDCAWSAYRNWFVRGLDWSWSLSDIGYHFRIEDELFRHWSEVLGERILVLDYERLVSDPGVEIARLTRHCGLDLEPRQLVSHLTDRSVTTASVEQVRSPIHTAAMGGAAPYRRWLTPFLDAYE